MRKETSPGSGVFTLSQTTTTVNNGTNDGAYNFIIRDNANYYVKFPTTNGGNVLSPATTTAATDDNSDASTTDGKSPVFAIDINGVGTAKDNNTIDAGYLALASLGDRVWLDSDRDGFQDVSEVGVSGVTVTLYNGSGVAVSATKTDAVGNYLFTGLQPGDYSVGFSLPTNYVFSPKGTGLDSGLSDDSDANTATGRSNTVSLGAGETDLKVDAGIYFASPTKQSIGDYVWYDSDGDGVQGASERGVSGVLVTLYDGTGKVVSVTTTDGKGGYLFSDVAVGTYSVGFSAPPGYVFTGQTNGTTDGSDVNASTGRTPLFTISAGESRLDIDAGLQAAPSDRASLGDYVWHDTNNNGVQDLNEVGVGGVTVELYTMQGDSLSSSPVLTMTTDERGRYLFSNLESDAYVVKFSLPSGYVFSPLN